MLYFASVLHIVFYVSYLVQGGVDVEQDKYLRENFKIECGVQPSLKQSSSTKGRIINGESTDSIYPWMTRIWRKSNGRWASSTGSIITNNAVLTCGHCICEPGCLPDFKDPQGKPRAKNQNQRDKNEIHISVGSSTSGKAPTSLTHEDHIFAYLHKYEKAEDQRFFSNNGDIGCR